jgi:predicted transport protein
MPIFKNHGGKLNKLNALTLDKEKKLQKLVEENLMEVLELLFLASEYVTTLGGRIDTLAVDIDGAPVIIEYKRNKNDNVINQSLSYLKWLKTQKPGFFEKLMMDKLGHDVAANIKLDWNKAWVLCIAESFSKYDIDTVEVVPLRIELMRYRYYEGDIFTLDLVTLAEPALPEPLTSQSLLPEALAPAAVQPQEAASLEDLRSKASDKIRSLFDELRERLLMLDDSVNEKPNTLYVAYRVSKNFAEVHIGKNQIKIFLRPIDYVDPQGSVDKIPDGYNWTLNRRVYLKSADELDYVFGLIEQSYKNVL